MVRAMSSRLRTIGRLIHRVVTRRKSLRLRVEVTPNVRAALNEMDWPEWAGPECVDPWDDVLEPKDGAR